eukprot:2331365-Prymnesium_polylepis.1
MSWPGAERAVMNSSPAGSASLLAQRMLYSRSPWRRDRAILLLVCPSLIPRTCTPCWGRRARPAVVALGRPLACRGPCCPAAPCRAASGGAAPAPRAPGGPSRVRWRSPPYPAGPGKRRAPHISSCCAAGRG